MGMSEDFSPREQLGQRQVDWETGPVLPLLIFEQCLLFSAGIQHIFACSDDSITAQEENLVAI